MEVWQPSTLSWSFSRRVHFDSCRRHYFYHRFWGQDPKLRWRLFEMRNLTTLTMLRGQVVHNVIAGALRSVRYGETVDVDTAKKSVTAVIRERYMESAKRLWHLDNRPQGRKASDITSLMEHYYKFPNINERAREAQLIAWQCVENLIGSDFWGEIIGSDPGAWIEVEDGSFPTFDIDGIQVYTVIDFAHSNTTPTIIDWKTGRPGEQDRKQLMLYSLYAQRKWDWDPTQVRLQAVYLYPELRLDTFTATQDELTEVKSAVKQSFDEMAALEPLFGPAEIENFPPAQDKSDCPWCRFQGACEARAASLVQK